MKYSILPVFALVLFGLVPAFADQIVFDSPANTNDGTVFTFTLDGKNIIASGFAGTTPTDLYTKMLGVDENGLGLTNDPSTNNEITHGSFIQLDLTALIAAGFTNFQFAMGSTTSPDAWAVSVCSSSSGGVDCNSNTVTGADEGTNHSVSGLSASSPYLDFTETTASSGDSHPNVLLSSLSATPPGGAPAPVPEPSSIVLLGTVLAVASSLIRRRA